MTAVVAHEIGSGRGRRWRGRESKLRVRGSVPGGMTVAPARTRRSRWTRHGGEEAGEREPQATGKKKGAATRHGERERRKPSHLERQTEWSTTLLSTIINQH